MYDDHYETLQVHPKADTEAIRAAYERLIQRYDPAKLEGAADELIDLARARRDAIERAYLILSDSERRANYDREAAQRAGPVPAAPAKPPTSGQVATYSTSDEIDYRPLPPARRQARPNDFDPQPKLSQPKPRRGRATASSDLPLWVIPSAIVASITFVVLLISLFVTVTTRPAPTVADPNAPQAFPTQAGAEPTPSVEQIVNQFEGQIIAARQVVQQRPENFNAWIELGNALYDSVQVARELIPGSPTFIERLPRWLEAADAYGQASALRPQDPLALADRGASLCYYGEAANDDLRRREGLTDAQRAATLDAQDERVMLVLGVCLAYQNPPQTDAALTQWQQLLALPAPDQRIAFQAQALLAEFGQ